MIKQDKEETHFTNRSVSSRPKPRSMLWTLDISVKTGSGLEQMSKDRAGGRGSGVFASVRWGSGRGWDEASLFYLSVSESSCLATAG